jgi:putative ABC transport system substrate-binding protein
MKLYLSLFSKVDNVGMIFDANNPAGYLAEEPFLQQTCESRGLDFHSIGVKEKGELKEASNRLIEKGVQLIVIPTNKLVYGNLDIVLEQTNKHNIPVVSMNKQSVEQGALAGLFADTYNLGRLTAPMAKKIMQERVHPKDIPFGYIDTPEIILNLNAAEVIDYNFPPTVLGSAAIVLQ